ncbi:uncharacterized protein LOC114729420 [Neltuma alba]|uniref:uncharacterized protein LOC114729420 n=1 Tax=Neltuma alba TaxID=207710 RepID=UPI0010A373AA|nr:uncharacterized protein LOC114729420 [Prosopis alba]
METRDLSRFISRRDWHNAVELCKSNPRLLSQGMTNSKDTALHVAINDNRDDVVEKLIGIIESKRTNQALIARNNKKETPLHCAAARGSVQMCELILRAGDNMREDLLGIPNKWYENPIFVAVVHNRKLAFICLFDAARKKGEGYSDLYRYLVINRDTDRDAHRDTDADADADRDTVLHSAIRRGHADLAFYIIKKCPGLSHEFNTKGVSPLELLARTPSLFRSSYNLSWWKHIIYFCIQVDPLKCDPNPTSKTNPDRKSSNKRHDKKDEAEPVMNPKNSAANQSFPYNWATCYEILAFVYLNFLGMMGLGNIFTKIKRVKEKYTWSLQLLDQLLENYCNEEIMKHAIDPESGSDYDLKHATDLESGSDHNPFEMLAAFRGRGRSRGGGGGNGGGDRRDKVEDITNKALLAAAETGVIEVVDKILRRFPGIIPEDTVGRTNKNILMVAVENQQAEIFVALRQHLKNVSGKPNLWHDLVHAVDDENNTILHIAAKYDESLSHGWQAYGYAMQMQCEITWYEFVKSFVPSHYLFLKNRKGKSTEQIFAIDLKDLVEKGNTWLKDTSQSCTVEAALVAGVSATSKSTQGKTPEQIFTRDHKDLLEKGTAWLKDTSQSCSVVAALVAGVSFATSKSIPGSVDAKGKPTLEEHPAFQLFAISGLIGLGFSVTSLIMFLSILTSRKQPIDFKRNLPFKLLLGLSSLFVSIASMFISFCASHFFVVEDKFKKGIFPLYAVTCLPISFYAIAQFPLYLNLMKAIVKDVPQSQKSVQL